MERRNIKGANWNTYTTDVVETRATRRTVHEVLTEIILI
jgi:hypothetical protein